MQLHGRKLWRVFPPNQTRYLHPAKSTGSNGSDAQYNGSSGHYTANTLAPDAALHPDLLNLETGFEFTLLPGQLALIPEGWAVRCRRLSARPPARPPDRPTDPARPPTRPRLPARPPACVLPAYLPACMA